MADWQPLGHLLVTRFSVPSGYWYICECGAKFWGRWDYEATKRYGDHLDEEAENRLKVPDGP